MPLLDDLQQLAKLHSSGDLTTDEYTTAKQRLLNAQAMPNENQEPKDSAVSNRLLLEAELARVDREFHMARERLSSTTHRGGTAEPSHGSTIAGILFAAFVIFFIVTISSNVPGGVGGFLIFPIIILFAVVFGIFSNESRLTQLTEAREKHEMERAKIKQQLEQEPPLGPN